MTHAEIIGLWPSIAQFARDLGVAYESAKAMSRRSSIPATYWKRVVQAAAAIDLQCVTYAALAEAVATEDDFMSSVSEAAQ